MADCFALDARVQRSIFGKVECGYRRIDSGIIERLDYRRKEKVRRPTKNINLKMPNIIIYSTPSCVYCKMAKEFFKKNNAEYVEHNVAEDMKAQEEMISKSHQLGVPVIDIGGEIFVGFDKKGISRALGLSQ